MQKQTLLSVEREIGAIVDLLTEDVSTLRTLQREALRLDNSLRTLEASLTTNMEALTQRRKKLQEMTKGGRENGADHEP